MNIIIIGAGNVGFTSAETLSTVHNVMIIEKDNAKADAIKNMLNVSVLHEDGTNPRVLESAIKKHDADLIVSTLASDGMNLFVCITCKGYRPSLRTVATIKNPDYVIKTTAEGNEGVDMIISPQTTIFCRDMALCRFYKILYPFIIFKASFNPDILVTSRIRPLQLKIVDLCFAIREYQNKRSLLAMLGFPGSGHPLHPSIYDIRETSITTCIICLFN